MSLLTDPTLNTLQRGMTLALHRQNVLTSNVVNLDTPGFTPSDVNFAAALRDAGSSLRPAALERAAANNVVTEQDRAPGLDGNSVDLDLQMGRIAQNSIFYAASARATTKRMALLRYVVSEGVR